MKKRKILFGIIAAILMFGTVSAKGENPFGSGKTSEEGLQFLGPDNLAGRSRTIVVDKTVGNGSVLYTGGVAGGLFKSENGGKTWTRIPCIIDGKEENLPISCITQLRDGSFAIGTGEGLAISNLDAMGLIVPKGKGLYRYTPSTGVFVRYPFDAAVNKDWTYINDMVLVDSMLYVATNGGMLRCDSRGNYDVLFSEGKVADVDYCVGDTVVYFTSGAKVCKISVDASSEADIVVLPTIHSENASRVELAVAPSNKNYIYISVADSIGLLEGVYLADTVDHTTWTKISTSSVTLFVSYNGWFANTLVVNPSDPKKILVGGTDVWSAEALEGTSLYSWSTESVSAIGRPSAYYVHENIHDITFVNDSVYYLATDGGIFKYGTIYDGITIIGQDTIGFSEMNKGLTTTQFTSVAVANDGSVFGGTLGHAVSYIKSRNDSDITVPTDDPINHSAESMWMGNGGWIATSMVHQTAPAEKSVVFVGSEGAMFGRATSDYMNYTNTQTWTISTAFSNQNFSTGFYNPPMILWEKFDDTKVIDSLTFTLRAPFVITRKIDGKDSNIVVTDTTKILAGDVAKVRCQANTDYPLNYTFTENFTMTNVGVTYTIKNPYQSRLFLAAAKAPNRNYVFMSPTATDFRKVETDMKWFNVMELGTSVARVLAISEDGDCLFIGAESANGGSYLIRVRKIATVDPSIIGVFETNPYAPGETLVDTIITATRVITSIAVDPNADNIVVTCKGEQNGGNEMYYVANATADQPTVTPKDLFGGTTSIYSSLVVKDEGIIYLGTENGLYTMANANATPEAYEGMNGVVVSFMTQQVDSLPFVKATYYTGTTPEEYAFGRTKDYRAIYLATYGNGIYVDKSFVNDTLNEVGIADVEPENIGAVRIYPNPAASYTNVELQVAKTTDATVRVFDMSGKVVYTKSLENLTAGVHTEAINCQGLQKGVYLINVVTDSQMMTSKLVVK